MVGRHSRRALLGGLGGAVLLGGCGGGGEDTLDEVGGQAVRNDARVLLAALEVQRRERDLYRQAARDARGARRALLERLERVEAEHVRRVGRAIVAAGGRVPDEAPAPRPDRPVTLRDLRAAERDAVEAWIDLVPKLSQPSTRRLAGALATVEAQQAAALERGPA